MSERRKRVMAGIVGLALVAMAGVSASAAGTWYSFNVTVPDWGGSTTTNNERKTVDGAYSIKDVKVGTNHTVSVRLEDLNFNALSSYSVIATGVERSFSSSGKAGQTVHMRLKTSTFQPANIQVQGLWSPDNPDNL
ncbi:MAG: hypothetical protein L6E13_04745 [Firmicutes bacterium]|nr:hypothetical protein [Bacillota bacterium]